LSITGCFVESLEPTSPGQDVAIRIQLPGGDTIAIDAEVVYSSPPMGFGVRFTGMSDQARDLLASVVERLLRESNVGLRAG
jgi:hypothetical protein